MTDNWSADIARSLAPLLATHGASAVRNYLLGMLYLRFMDPEAWEWFAAHSSGTAIPSINTKTLGSLPVSLPPLTIQLAIGQTLDALNQKIVAHESICRATAEIRDALLPLLLSGRVTP